MPAVAGRAFKRKLQDTGMGLLMLFLQIVLGDIFSLVFYLIARINVGNAYFYKTTDMLKLYGS